jgi:hypothetical protein
MKLPPSAYIVAALTVILSPVSRVTAQDAPAPQNKTALLQELDKITSGSETIVRKRRAEAISRVQSASSSGGAAVELYLNALDNTRYREKHQEFIDWRQKNQDCLRHASFQNAAQLQLRYLLLALQRSDQKTALTQIPESLAYLKSLQELHFLEEPQTSSSAQKSNRGMQAPPPSSDKVIPEASAIIKQPIRNCAVVEWFQISDLLPEGKDFEGSAGNFAGIIDKNVKNPLRGTNDPRLPGAWDFQINAESAVANSGDSPQKTETFRNERLPELIFLKLKDTAAIGQPNRALNELMTLIRTYPSNHSVNDWITTARGMLTNSSVTQLPPATPQAASTNLTTPPADTGTNTPVAPPAAPAQP